jgi:solute carrier family 25 carnitine/acylcarnitine transporter 20/29
MFSGAICSILTAPLELIRTKLQAQTFQEKLYSGPLDCAKKIYSHSGIKGLYRGVGLTFCREIPANAFYFSAFESILGNYGFNMSKSEDGQKRYHGAPPILVFLAGGLAGIANWAFIYPIDMLKSKYQADHLVHPRFSGMKDLFKHAALEARKTSGKSLFSGYSACLLRAFVANAATFSCVELCRKYLE